MKFNSVKIIVTVLFTTLTFYSCSHPTLRFDQTCITCIKSQRLSCSGDECPKSFAVGSDYLVTITETGENIHITDILNSENLSQKSGVPIALAKINGKIFLTGNSFKNLWILYPKSKNEARYRAVKLPQSDIINPIFEIFTSKLLLSAQNYSNKYIFDEENDKWIIHGALKGRE